jgi:hypothetical protein
MSDTWARRAPWTGIAAVICVLAAIILGGETPDFDASRAEIIDHYDDETAKALAAAFIALTALFFVFFASSLRARLRAAESASTLTMVGGALFAVGLALFAGIEFTLTDLVNSDNPIDPGALQALNAMDNDLFLPAQVGLAIFYFSTAFGILGTGALPRWLGWVTLVLAIMSVLGPLGFLAFVLAAPWTLVTAIILIQSGGEPATSIPETGPAP